MNKLHIISHTHWDREWYLTFQQFRLKLVDLVDKLLEILDSNDDFRYFLLDGQTIILDDYLQIRPEKYKQLRKYVRKGRIQIGPWYILPDMFLVGPEAHIRNLLQGERTAKKFGPKMMVGYIPDPFGHPGQVPQILRGFGIKTACVWRGLADQPAEFWWESPDGSRVLMAYMRDSYSNGAGLVTDNPELFTQQLKTAQASLAAASVVQDHLIMLGTDHMEPSPKTSTAIAYADHHLIDTRVLHSNLPKFVKAIRKQVVDGSLPVVTGELRECKNSPLLPGVLSSRMWIKQRNHASEVLLISWAEPFSSFADMVYQGRELSGSTASLPIHNEKSSLLQDPAAFIRYAWRLLMENHPHDSICGCSIDQVHVEMRLRFDQVDQIGEEITRQSLQTLSDMINTRFVTANPTISVDPMVGIAVNDSQGDLSAVVVFNPGDTIRTSPIGVVMDLPGKACQFEIIDINGQVIPHKSHSTHQREMINMILDRKGLQDGLSMVNDGLIAGMAVQEMTLEKVGELVNIRMLLNGTGPPNLKAWQAGLEEGRKYLEDPEAQTFHVLALSVVSPLVKFIASEVPPHGWKTYWIRTLEGLDEPPAEVPPLVKPFLPLGIRLVETRIGNRVIQALTTRKHDKPPFVIENEFLQVEANQRDGLLTIRDLRTGMVFRDQNRFVDGGDAGDEYNYSPPERDAFTTAKVESIRVQQHSIVQSLEISYRLKIPVSITPDRNGRAEKTVILPIQSYIHLYPGVARIDIETEVDNFAKDHRLRVHFPAPFQVDHADYDGHFEVVRRPVGVSQPEDDWAEEPRPEVPQRAFVDISDGKVGLMVANRGLPEVEVLVNEDGNGEVALTLLRCVEWLSRDDLRTRDGHAGPGLHTPGAQMSGKWRFEYCLIPHKGGWKSAYSRAYGYQTPMRAISTGVHNGVLESEGAFLKVSTDSFSISAVKATEDGRGWLVRGYNLTAEPIEIRLTPLQHFPKAELVNLAEKRVRKLKPGLDGMISFKAGGHKIVSVVFRD